MACLESLKGEFGLLTSATTTPGLLECFVNALHFRKVDVIPMKLGLEMPRCAICTVCALAMGLCYPCQLLYQCLGMSNGSAWVLTRPISF